MKVVRSMRVTLSLLTASALVALAAPALAGTVDPFYSDVLAAPDASLGGPP